MGSGGSKPLTLPEVMQQATALQRGREKLEANCTARKATMDVRLKELKSIEAQLAMQSQAALNAVARAQTVRNAASNRSRNNRRNR